MLLCYSATALAMFSKNNAIPTPCVKCNGEELRQLHNVFDNSDKEFWVYKVAAYNCCDRCDTHRTRALWRNYPSIRGVCCVNPFNFVQVPIQIETVGTIERAVHASCIADKGSAYRAHGTFISHLSLLDAPEILKQSLCAWAPKAMMDYGRALVGTERLYRRGRLYQQPSIPEPPVEINTDAVAALVLPAPNEDSKDGMKGSNVSEKDMGLEDEDRISGGVSTPVEPKVLAHQIGPDLIPTEVFESSVTNLKTGLKKRVQPLGFKASKNTIRKIEKTVNALMQHVFPREAIVRWREENPDIDEFKSSKWDGARWAQAVDDAFADINAKIEQTAQIKLNEALPAKGKAPRPILQCGDRAQVMMNLPVKCFEDLLFHYFEEASIKHIDKLGAMKRVASHLRQRGANVVEGDGSAWDSCCNPKIRAMTENRIIRHIIEVLSDDPQVPKSWLLKTMDDMDKKFIKGKCKVTDFCNTPLKFMIESIRQSGHRGTSCFNYLINLVCWLVVLCEHPERMIIKTQNGELRAKYISARDKQTYTLKYAFEGDDSAISTTEHLESHADAIEAEWKSMGFRMKLIYVKDKMTFTGYDFLCDSLGPTDVMIPEVCRNIASSSWTCSSLVKSFPHKKHEVGAAAMLARAINFKECGAFSRYFAALGLAHIAKVGDMALDETEAKKLGINVSPSVKEDLHELYTNAGVMSFKMRELVNTVIPFSKDQELRMLTVDFGSDPTNLMEARRVVPFCIWDPSKYDTPRR